MGEHSICVTGLPDSGKTTFIAALVCRLDKGGYEGWSLRDTGNDEYLQKIAEKWYRCEEMGHTKTKHKENVSFQLENPELDELLTLQMSDRAGEFFRMNVRTEEDEAELKDIITNSNQILLFVNPDQVERQPLLGTMQQELEKVGIALDLDTRSETKASVSEADDKGSSEADGQDNEQNNDSKKKLLFHPGENAEHAALLQTLLDAVGRWEKLRLSVIVSAWDNYKDDKTNTPEKVIKEDIPLFWNVLTANRNRLDITFWGVSAQGCNWKNEKERDDMLSIDDIRKRVILVDDQGKPFDNIMRILIGNGD